MQTALGSHVYKQYLQINHPTGLYVTVAISNCACEGAYNSLNIFNVRVYICTSRPVSHGAEYSGKQLHYSLKIS